MLQKRVDRIRSGTVLRAAMVLHSLCLSSCPSNNNLILPNNNLIFRNNNNNNNTITTRAVILNQKRDFSTSSLKPTSQTRRDLTLLGLTSLSLTCLPFSGISLSISLALSARFETHLFYYHNSFLLSLAATHAEEQEQQQEQDTKMASFIDEINAYSYLYPLELPSKKLVFKWYVCHFFFHF